jgi:hypothetical protein
MEGSLNEGRKEKDNRELDRTIMHMTRESRIKRVVFLFSCPGYFQMFDTTSSRPKEM